MEKDKL